ncbi:MAG: hypothetical protein GC154_13020 [bacterium]|nr:hypothetical protein [bacterium]
MKRMPVWAALAALTILTFNAPGWCDQIKPMALSEITRSAEIIFEGECLDVRSGLDPESGLAATWYTFRVLDGVKGGLDETFVLKQYGGVINQTMTHSPSASYEKGEHVIVFLYGISKIGFSSAVGLKLGKFNVEEHPETRAKYVTNGEPAAVLFPGGVSSTASIAAPASIGVNGKPLNGVQRLQSSKLEHDGFMDAVKALVEVQAEETERAKQ